ncbi:MAG: 8-amino-7-oxononanoate synthase [Candidatus Margulisiibacteriota bacterium]
MSWPVIDTSEKNNVRINENYLINFTSNDYLGLAQHEVLKNVVADSILKFGIGSTGSRRLSGNHQAFLNAEESIANWIGKESAVMFNSGYQMNSSIFSVLASTSTLIIADKLIHASLIDGIQFSKAQLVRFRHNDMDHLSQLLKKYAHQYESILIVCESIYSMDGDEAPIEEIIEFKKMYNATLIVDEAHSIGLYGNGGNGWLNKKQFIDSVDIVLVPFGKAFGLTGAMLISNQEISAQMKAKCRGYIYTTALPIGIAVGIEKSIQLIVEANDLRNNLIENIKLFKSIISTTSFSQIQPIIVGSNQQASIIESALIESGFFVRAVHHPTVPKGESRLRITLTAQHHKSQIIDLANHIKHHLSSSGTNI